jgi:outer membrane autotransporter protein
MPRKPFHRNPRLHPAPTGDTGSFAAGLAGLSLTNGGPIDFTKSLQLNAQNVNGLEITHDINLQQRMTFNSATAGEHQTFSGQLSGTNGIAKTGEGTIILSGNNSYSGGTLLEMGELRMTHNNAIGTGTLTVNNLGSTFLTFTDGVTIGNDINLNTSTIVAPDTGTTATLAGDISETGGPWGLTKDNVSTLVLRGNNTFTGGVYVIDGTVRVESDTALGTGTLTLPGAVTLDLAEDVTIDKQVLLQNNVFFNVDSGTATMSGSVEDIGGFEKTGNGALILSGTTSHTGGTTVSGGILQGNTDNLQGDIVNNGILIFDQEGVGAYSGVISGSGSVTKVGANLLVMSGNNTYTGPTSVGIGEVRVEGSLVSDVTIGLAGVLSGNGTTGSVTNEGLLQPGVGDVGELHVDGYAQNATGTLEIDINDGGTVPGVNNDHLDVVGPAAVTGTLNVNAAPGSYTTGTQYIILSAGGGVTGVFTSVTDNLSLFDVSAIYNVNDITIELQRILALRDVGTTANQQAVGGALDNIALTATGDLQTLINELGAASTADQQLGLSQLSGEGYGTTQTIGIQSGIQFQNSVTDRLTNNGNFLTSAGGSLVSADLAEEDVWLVGARDQSQRRGWLQGFGTSAQISGDGNAAASDYRQGGVAVGLDLGSDETGVVGISNGNSFLSFGQDNGSFGNMNSHHFGLYGVRQMDPLYVLGSTSYGYSDIDMTRSVPGGTVQGSPVAHQIGAYAETGVSLDGSMVRIQPLVALQYQLFSQQSFSETGGPGALNVAGQQANSLRAHLGARMSFSELQDSSGRLWTPYVHARWVAELLDDDRLVNASIIGAPAGGSFVTAGNGLGRHFAVVGTGVNVELTDHWSLFSNYDLQAGGGLTAHTGSGGLTYQW